MRVSAAHFSRLGEARDAPVHDLVDRHVAEVGDPTAALLDRRLEPLDAGYELGLADALEEEGGRPSQLLPTLQCSRWRRTETHSAADREHDGADEPGRHDDPAPAAASAYGREEMRVRREERRTHAQSLMPARTSYPRARRSVAWSLFGGRAPGVAGDTERRFFWSSSHPRSEKGFWKRTSMRPSSSWMTRVLSRRPPRL